MNTSTDARSSDDVETTADLDPEDVATPRDRVDELEDELADAKAAANDGPKKMTIVATESTFDVAYPPLILASTAAAFGRDVVFHTFWGLDILHDAKSDNLKLSAVGNPSMPMPNAVATLPLVDSMATKTMQKKTDEQGIATIEELIETSLDVGVDLQACQMTTDGVRRGRDVRRRDHRRGRTYRDRTRGRG